MHGSLWQVGEMSLVLALVKEVVEAEAMVEMVAVVAPPAGMCMPATTVPFGKDVVTAPRDMSGSCRKIAGGPADSAAATNVSTRGPAVVIGRARSTANVGMSVTCVQIAENPVILAAKYNVQHRSHPLNLNLLALICLYYGKLFIMRRC